MEGKSLEECKDGGGKLRKFIVGVNKLKVTADIVKLPNSVMQTLQGNSTKPIPVYDVSSDSSEPETEEEECEIVYDSTNTQSIVERTGRRFKNCKCNTCERASSKQRSSKRLRGRPRKRYDQYGRTKNAGKHLAKPKPLNRPSRFPNTSRILHQCPVCKLAYKAQAALTWHLRSVHNLQREPYQCFFCSKEFAFKSILETHIRRHIGEKPYSCQVCQKSFVSGSALNAHAKIHHHP